MTDKIIETYDKGEKNFSISFFSPFQIFLRIFPWTILIIGILCFIGPLIRATSGAHSFIDNLFAKKEIYFWIPAFMFVILGYFVIHYRKGCQDYLFFDFNRSEIILHIVFKKFVFQRILGSTEDIYCVSMDGEVLTNNSYPTTYVWECIVLNSGKKIRISERVRLSKLTVCTEKCEMIAELLGCPFIKTTKELPVLVVDKNDDKTIEVFHKARHSVEEEGVKLGSLLLPVFFFVIIVLAGLIFYSNLIGIG